MLWSLNSKQKNLQPMSIQERCLIKIPLTTLWTRIMTRCVALLRNNHHLCWPSTTPTSWSQLTTATMPTSNLAKLPRRHPTTARIVKWKCSSSRRLWCRHHLFKLPPNSNSNHLQLPCWAIKCTTSARESSNSDISSSRRRSLVAELLEAAATWWSSRRRSWRPPRRWPRPAASPCLWEIAR